MYDDGLMTVLAEEIGNPQLFTGREQELNFLMNWAEQTKGRLAKSHVLLARKRRGKTALIQRFFNMVFTRNDPEVIPFYIRVPDAPVSLKTYTESFFHHFVTQYLAYKLRRPDLLSANHSFEKLLGLAPDDEIFTEQVGNVLAGFGKNWELSWEKVREFGHDLAIRKDERIIQIIDEFQYMSEMIVHEGQPINLCRAYQMTASSPVSPQLITGSYIGWLGAIVNKMVGRYRGMDLGPLPPDEALATVYTYARIYRREIDPDQAAYLADLCYGDPYYIAQIFESNYAPETKLTQEIIRKTLDHETRPIGGEITKMWGDYILSAIERVNDRNAKKIILYLAKHSDREFSRDEIRQNLDLDLTDHDLEKRLNKLVRSDILAQGRTMFHYKGLGDPIFEIIFRRLYQAEIDKVDVDTIESQIEERLTELKGRLANVRGLAAEKSVRYGLLQAGRKRIRAAGLSLEPATWAKQNLGDFIRIKKRSLHPLQDRRIEIDLFAEAESPESPDLVIEVKDHERKVGAGLVDAFIAKKTEIEPLLERPTLFMMYSEHGFTRGQAKRLDKHNILACDGRTLARRAEID